MTHICMQILAIIAIISVLNMHLVSARSREEKECFLEVKSFYILLIAI